MLITGGFLFRPFSWLARHLFCRAVSQEILGVIQKACNKKSSRVCSIEDSFKHVSNKENWTLVVSSYLGANGDLKQREATMVVFLWHWIRQRISLESEDFRYTQRADLRSSLALVRLLEALPMLCRTQNFKWYGYSHTYGITVWHIYLYTFTTKKSTKCRDIYSIHWSYGNK